MPANTHAPELKRAILSYPEVAVLLNISQESLYRWQRTGLFPKPTKYGPRRVGWPREVVEQWLADKRAALSAE